MCDTQIALIASDHAGIEVKRFLFEYTQTLGIQVEDLGAYDTTPVDYPAIGHRLAREVVAQEEKGKNVFGILVCGSGIGMSIAANKVVGVRAALVHNAYTARMAREHNNANVVVVGARVLGSDLLKECIRVFSETTFSENQNSRHFRRIQALEV